MHFVLHLRFFLQSGSLHLHVNHRPRMMEPEMHESLQPTWNSTNRPRPGYCFQCGKDGHLAVNCENDPNPHRVEEKHSELRDRQATCELKNPSNSQSLN